MHIISNPEAAAPEASGVQGKEFLVFGLGKEEYAIDIQKVQELRGYDTVTHIANAPDFIKGVINLRGIIVPIIDMRIRFRLGTAAYDVFTVVVILNVAGQVVGMVVDGVSDVVTIMPDEIKPVPDIRQSTLDTSYLVGMGTLGGRMLSLVDIDKLMSAADIGLIQALAA